MDFNQNSIFSLILAVFWGVSGLSHAQTDVSLANSSVRTPESGPRQIQLPDEPFRYRLESFPVTVTAVMTALDNTPSDNPITDHGATLGRVLFYDRSLSVNGTVSCASCHDQKHAFSDPRASSLGFDGQSLARNSMSLVNLRFYRRGRFFWDERAASLEDQVLMPIENRLEMGHDLDQLVPQLQQDPIYPPLFRNAFNDPKVTEQRIAKALAQFVRSIVSFNSRYDIGLAQTQSPLEPFPNFTEQENLGKQQFFGRALCAECHLPGYRNEPFSSDRTNFPSSQWLVFQLRQPTNNGIDSGAADDDFGVATHSGNARDRGLFKASTLRNIDLTGPYMHDGRFETIDQVIEHYNWSVRPQENLDERLRDFAANGLALPEVPKVALAKFLSTLTDESLLTDPKYSDPFVEQPQQVATSD
ncbi:cytochrome-c peroxidase [Stieleria sp. TO1_6]|uniref:cytochrome-c peroxidase n=1 Tax=Stieleria tagensis TaxID=2956795 RepID=UPI00209A6A4C|nr:cytochrome c peroxidase [Stieleria tagensis]MCO8124516.1 cytochrome-c peroxidase [Stieleria tagensis]